VPATGRSACRVPLKFFGQPRDAARCPPPAGRRRGTERPTLPGRTWGSWREATRQPRSRWEGRTQLLGGAPLWPRPALGWERAAADAKAKRLAPTQARAERGAEAAQAAADLQHARCAASEARAALADAERRAAELAAELAAEQRAAAAARGAASGGAEAAARAAALAARVEGLEEALASRDRALERTREACLRAEGQQGVTVAQLLAVRPGPVGASGTLARPLAFADVNPPPLRPLRPYQSAKLTPQHTTARPARSCKTSRRASPTPSAASAASRA
jgi:hypothetical protein